MGRIKIKQQINIYEIDGKITPPSKDYEQLGVDSHGNYQDWVVIRLPGGGSFTVGGKDLKLAIDNAMNTGG